MSHPSVFLHFQPSLNPFYPQITSVPGAAGGDERTRSRSGQKPHLSGSQRFNHVGPSTGEDVTNLPNSPLFWVGINTLFGVKYSNFNPPRSLFPPRKAHKKVNFTVFSNFRCLRRTRALSSWSLPAPWAATARRRRWSGHRTSTPWWTSNPTPKTWRANPRSFSPNSTPYVFVLLANWWIWETFFAPSPPIFAPRSWIFR